jgi:hypothetical protein
MVAMCICQHVGFTMAGMCSSKTKGLTFEVVVSDRPKTEYPVLAENEYSAVLPLPNIRPITNIRQFYYIRPMTNIRQSGKNYIYQWLLSHAYEIQGRYNLSISIIQGPPGEFAHLTHTLHNCS